MQQEPETGDMVSTMAEDHDRPPSCNGKTAFKIEDIQQTMSNYIGQLIHGCGHSGCTEVLCHTGRCNTAAAGKPIRRYTRRAAHMIALTVCSGDRPLSHICPHFQPALNVPDEPLASNLSIDPSSLVQLLSGTSGMRSLVDSSQNLQLPDMKLQQMHEVLSVLLDAAGRLPTGKDDTFISNTHLARALFTCMNWLLSKVPLQRLSPWVMVDVYVITKGLAFPQKHENRPADESFNTWMAILDLLNHEPYLRLLERIALVVSQRRQVEHAIAAARQRENGVPVRHVRSIGNLLGDMLIWSDTHENSITAMSVWLKRLFAKIWDNNAVVALGGATYGLLEILRGIFIGSPAAAPETSWDLLTIGAIPRRIGAVELCQAWMAAQDKSELHLFNWNFLFKKSDLVLYFRTINHLTMKQAHSESEKANALERRNPPLRPASTQLQHSEGHYLLLNVSRENVLTDALDQLWQRRDNELRRPLRVRLGEVNELEIGHDLGGVQIEFFNLICAQVFQKAKDLFTTDDKTQCSYFKAGSLQPLHVFELLGVLFSLALYNGIAVPVCFPTIFYDILIGNLDILLARLTDTSVVRLHAIRDGWPQVAKSLESILEGDVEDLDFTFPLEANGVLMEVSSQATPNIDPSPQGIVSRYVTSASMLDNGGMHVDPNSLDFPGWAFKPLPQDSKSALVVTPENKREYVQQYIRWLAYDSVRPQWIAFLKGFNASGAWKGNKLSFLTATQLKHIMEGSSKLDINELRRATQYEGYHPQSKYIDWFWRIVMSWDEKRQKELLKFVTAAERIPITGASSLTFVIKKADPVSLEALPTSSTCFGTLMLPRYPSQAILAAKLELALKYGLEGFGTG